MKNLREIFNPSKITISGKSIIVDTDSGRYVIKVHNKDIKKLYNYFESRDFTNYPKIIDEYDDKYVYEYLDEVDIPLSQKSIDMAKTLGLFHYKTSHFKNIVIDDIKRVYEDIETNINYMDNYFHKIYDLALSEEYIRPSLYIYLINSSKINALISWLRSELESWNSLAINEDKFRVCYCHNHLCIDHYLNNNFISWDNYTIDSPVLDLINLYKTDYNKYDFKVFLDTYLKYFELSELEKKLLFISISIPKINYENSDELSSSINASKFLDYISKTENLIRPYYSK